MKAGVHKYLPVLRVRVRRVVSLHVHRFIEAAAAAAAAVSFLQT